MNEEIKSRATTLLELSIGESLVSKQEMNSFFFLEDYERFLNCKIDETPINSLQNFTSENPEKFGEKIKEKNSNNDVIDPQESEEEDLLALNEEQKKMEREGNFDKEDEKDLILSYLKNPNGRKVDTIFNKVTHRPTNMVSLIESQKITDESLTNFITLEQVTHLNLENCFHISPHVFKNIGKFCQNLKILKLENCNQIDDPLMVSIIKGCKNIVSLNLAQIPKLTDQGLKFVLNCCSYLKVFIIHSNDSILGTSFQYLGESLEVLDISYCKNLKELAFCCISELCPNLIHLNCAGTNISDEGLLGIENNCEFIQTLRLMMCNKLTSQSLSTVTHYSPNLQVLELTGISSLNDETIKKLSIFSQRLLLLSLNGCNQLTDAAINSLAIYAKNLRVLEASNLKSITTNSLINLIHQISTLNTIFLNETSISSSEVQILKSVTSRCNIIKQGIVFPQIQQVKYFTLTKSQEKENAKNDKKKTKKKGKKKP